ncbi:MAG: hypoxanthine phosphoribosyltransferase [Planctomycetota bacterium]
MQADIAKILIKSNEIHARVRAMGKEIAATYNDDDRGLTLVPILSGSIIFLADLIRELPLKMKIALVQVSAYPGQTVTAQEPQTLMHLSGDVRGRNVLIVDDILDSGRTLRRVKEMVARHEPASVRAVVLLRKPSKAPADVSVDFIGFDVDDLFVVGYGLDYGDHYRNFPHIGVLRPDLMP